MRLVSRPIAAFLIAICALLVAAPARAQFPEGVASAFCQADGRGDRLNSSRAAIFNEFLPWRFEPAWDRIFLISGYEINPVRVGTEDAEILIRYSVVAEITGEGVREEIRQEAVRVTLALTDGAWRLVGPPPPPHLYASGADREQLFALLTPINPGYVSNSKFVWRMFQNAGWGFPYQPAAAFLGGNYFKAVPEPRVGDVVAYLSAGVPYHVGIYEGEDRVASATLSRGIVRAALNAFPGEVRYLRLTDAARPRTPESERLASTPVAPPLEDDGPKTEDQLLPHDSAQPLQ